MKICFLAPASNYHTQKWSKWFVSRGHEVHVVSFIDAKLPGVTVHFVDTGASVTDSDSKKLKYLMQARKIKKVVEEIHPDVLNVHYATSYGTVAALSGLHNYALSVWGSDIFEFPRKTPLHRMLLQFSLARARYLFSTSVAMAKEGNLYTKKEFSITPFGVDMELFHPGKRTRTEKDTDFVVGTVKSLSAVYGIDYLLKAVAVVRERYPQIPIRVRIAGKGDKAEDYRQLAKDLGIADITTWLGFISQEQAAVEWANMDVALVPSLQESFGVSAVEAQASGVPVIISDVEGLMEATAPGSSSIVVPKCNEQALAEAIAALYQDSKKRQEMGAYGRKFVSERYELDHCFETIENLFKKMQ